MPVTTIVRTLLYVLAIIGAIGTIATAAGFIHEVSELYIGYYEVSAELLAAGILLVITLPILHFGFHLRRVENVVASLVFEIAVLFILWALFLGGAAALTSDLGQVFNLRGCSQSALCTFGRAMEALAWVTWALLTLLLILALAVGLQSGNWTNSIDASMRGGKNFSGESRRTSMTSTTTANTMQGRDALVTRSHNAV